MTGHAPANPSLQRRALHMAAKWHAQLRSDSAGTAEAQALQNWLERDPVHRWAWNRLISLQRQLGQLPGNLALEAFERAELQFNDERRRILKSIILLAGVGSFSWAGYRQMEKQHWLADHRTATGEIATLTLADGSSLILNTATAMDIRFTTTERLIILHAGEVMIKTAKDNAAMARPFVVQTSQGRIRALGTRFSVREIDGQSRVDVFEHRVEVTTRHGNKRICPNGHGLQFNVDRIAMSEGALASDAWTRHMLVVDDLPLDEFIFELSRYRRGILRCDPALARYRISGAFKINDTRQALHAIARSFPVQVSYRTRFWVSVSALQ